MRKLILEVAVSLDGFIEGTNGEYDWCFNDQDYGLTDFFYSVDTLFIGRKTYEMMQGMDTTAQNEFSGLKKYVFSKTLDKVKDGAILIKDNIESEVKKIKNENGKDIWLFGGAGLTASLLNSGLVDKIRLAVHPILLGSGKYLFSGISDRIHLKLADTNIYSSGLVALSYDL